MSSWSTTDPKGDYDQWNIYTWNSGYGSAVTVWPDITNDKVFMITPVVESKHSMKLSFCMRRTEPGEKIIPVTRRKGIIP